MSRVFAQQVVDEHTAVGEYGDVIRRLITRVAALEGSTGQTPDPTSNPTPPAEPDIPPVVVPPTEVTYTETAADMVVGGAVTLSHTPADAADLYVLIGLNLAVGTPASVPTGWISIGSQAIGNLTSHAMVGTGQSFIDASNQVSYGGGGNAAAFLWQVEGTDYAALSGGTADQFSIGSGSPVAVLENSITEGRAFFAAAIIDGNPGTFLRFETDDNVDEHLPSNNPLRAIGGARRAPLGGGDIASQIYRIEHDSSIGVYGLVVQVGQSGGGTGNTTPPDGGTDPGTPVPTGTGGGRNVMNWGEGNPYTTFQDIVNFNNSIAPVHGLFEFNHLGLTIDNWSTLGSPHQGSEHFPIGLVNHMYNFISNHAGWFECTMQGWIGSPSIHISSYLSGGTSGTLHASIDAWLDKWVTTAKWALDNANYPGLKIIVRLMHEQNGSWVGPYYVGDSNIYAAHYVAAYKAIVDHVRGQMTTPQNDRLFFSWSPNSWTPGQTFSPVDAQPSYPGSAYCQFFAPSLYLSTPSDGFSVSVLGDTAPRFEYYLKQFKDVIDPAGVASGAVRMAIGEWGLGVDRKDTTQDFLDMITLAQRYQLAYVNWFYHRRKGPPGHEEPDWTLFPATASEISAAQQYVNQMRASLINS